MQRSSGASAVVLSIAVLAVAAMTGCASGTAGTATPATTISTTASSTTASSTTASSTRATTSTGVPAADGFSITGLLADTPVIAGPALISAADVETAIEDAGLIRPEGTGDAFLTWLSDTAGVEQGSVISIPWPDSLGIQYAAQHDTFAASVGFGIPQVDGFLAVSAPPARVAVLDGRFDPDAVTAAIGEPDDGIWSQPGEDLTTDLQHRLAPDELGRPVRVTGDEAQLLVTLQTKAAQAYRDGDLGSWSDVLPVAEALDARGVYAAQLWRAADDTVVGIGLVVEDGRSVPVVAHQYADAGEAEQAAAALDGRQDGPATAGDVAVDGALLTARLEWAPETAPAVAWQLLARQSPVLG
ncbi:hypothetical protein [Nakamurella leprariae]|uniref:Uncharacterized protein n=1 Tax=Nakamurella leprariae TaxID=2803911 RepID=A0A938YD35_9ACTN|nr:hypothetical protein [Nakamurella leprariae]MBM9465974.1 hypothetical protein [Nakamurella leprariae]